MDKVRILKELRKEAFRIKKKIGKIQDPKTKQRLKRNYSQLIGAVAEVADISKAEA